MSLMNANPQLGMWQASGLAIAQAPNLSELRNPNDEIEFNSQGHSMRTAIEESDGELALVKSITRRPTIVKMPSVLEDSEIKESPDQIHHHHHRSMHERAHDFKARRRALRDKHKAQCKEKWGPTMLKLLKALWLFVKTPSGFLITIYFLNIVVSSPLHGHKMIISKCDLSRHGALCSSSSFSKQRPP